MRTVLCTGGRYYRTAAGLKRSHSDLATIVARTTITRTNEIYHLKKENRMQNVLHLKLPTGQLEAYGLAVWHFL